MQHAIDLLRKRIIEQTFLKLTASNVLQRCAKKELAYKHAGVVSYQGGCVTDRAALQEFDRSASL